jgi:protein SCO1/2
VRVELKIRALLAAVLTLLAACSSSGPSFRNADITGADYGRNLVLSDHNGKQRTLADFRGKAVVMFFGFAHCPDVCPTTMLEIKQAIQDLGAEAQKVQVLFVTVDPERDTPEMLAKYVPSFDPSFIALRGDTEATAKVAKDFKVFYQKVPGKSAGSYTIDHTAGIYVFDTQGRVRLFARPGKPADLTADLRTLLQSES